MNCENVLIGTRSVLSGSAIVSDRLVGGEARHQVDRDRGVGTLRHGCDVLELELEERLPVEDLDCGFDDSPEAGRHAPGQNDRRDFTASHRFLAALGQRPAHVTPERGQGLKVAFVGRLHRALDPVLGRSKLAPKPGCCLSDSKGISSNP